MILIILYVLYDPAQYPFPPCPMLVFTGWLCPGCGSQRAVHQALHGQFGASFQLNALFLPALIYAAIGFLLPLYVPKKWPVIRSKFYASNATHFALAIIIIFWIGRNIL